MIYKGKTHTEIAKQLGVSKQRFSILIKKYPDNFWVENDEYYVYDSNTPKRLPCRNSNPAEIGTDISTFILRKDYAKKYGISIAYVSLLIKNKKLKTDKIGIYVEDKNVVKKRIK